MIYYDIQLYYNILYHIHISLSIYMCIYIYIYIYIIIYTYSRLRLSAWILPVGYSLVLSGYFLSVCLTPPDIASHLWFRATLRISLPSSAGPEVACSRKSHVWCRLRSIIFSAYAITLHIMYCCYYTYVYYHIIILIIIIRFLYCYCVSARATAGQVAEVHLHAEQPDRPRGNPARRHRVIRPAPGC